MQSDYESVLIVSFYGCASPNQALVGRSSHFLRDFAQSILTLPYKTFIIITDDSSPFSVQLIDKFKEFERKKSNITFHPVALEHDQDNPPYEIPRKKRRLPKANNPTISFFDTEQQALGVISFSDVVVILNDEPEALRTLKGQVNRKSSIANGLPNTPILLYVKSASFTTQLSEINRNRILTTEPSASKAEINQKVEELHQELETSSDLSLILKKFFLLFYVKLLNKDVLLRRSKSQDRASFRPIENNNPTLLAVDFGCVLTDQSTRTNLFDFLSFSSGRYQELLSRFLQDGSIMFNPDNKTGWYYDHPNGDIQSLAKVEFTAQQLKIDRHPSFSTFQNWSNFLKHSNYGQSIWWRNIVYKDFESRYKIDQSVFLLFNLKADPIQVSDFQKLTEEFLLEVGAIKVAALFSKKEQILLYQALRAAISQVMARNASHNIGSHVLTRLTDAKFIKEIAPNNGSYIGAFDLITKVNGRSLKKIEYAIEQIALFNSYLKTRMDYLSDLTWGVPVMQTNKKLSSDLFRDFDQVRLLLNNISGLNGWEFNIEVLVEGNLLDNTNDPIIAIPNDMLGMQAFYNILENIIRNTAKHNQNKDGITTFTINFKRIVSDEKQNEALDLSCIEIYDSIQIKDIAQRVAAQNTILGTPILESGFSLRSKDLGMIEMAASAAYLRKLDITLINDPKYQPKVSSNENTLPNEVFPILEAIDCDGALGYRFYVWKPLEAIFVTDQEFEKTLVDKWRENGVGVTSRPSFLKDLADGKVFCHEFLVYDVESLEDSFIAHQAAIPNRREKISTEEVKSLLSENKECSIDGIRKELWTKRRKTLLKRTTFSKVHIGNSPLTDADKPDEHFQIVLLDHGGGEWSKHAVDEKVNYLDALGSNAQRFLPGFGGDMKTYHSKAKRDVIFCPQVLEFASSHVVVIDERIQRKLFDKAPYKGCEIPYSELFSRTNILVPETTIDLGKDNFDEDLIVGINEFLSRITCNLNPTNDFIVFHFGVLTRMFGGNIDETKRIDSINNYLESFLENARVIVTSGAGLAPEKLSSKVSFVNLSPILNSIIGIRSKILTTAILHSSRKSTKI